MDTTRKKARKGPTISATLVSVGIVRTGNDGNRWRVEANKTGVHRWVLIKKGTRKVNIRNAKKGTRDTCYIEYKQSKLCKGKEEGACDPFMSDNLLDAIGWTMGFPNYSNDKAYDFSIYIEGPSETKAAAKAIVTKAYTKIKERGAINQFRVIDA